jgi:uncharacterized membrane protein
MANSSKSSSSKPSNTKTQRSHSRLRIIVMALVGILVGIATGLLGFWPFAPAIGWAVASAIYLAWVWSTIGRMDAARTAEHALREDPTRGIADTLILIASIASLAAVIALVVQGQSAHGAAKIAIPIVAFLSIGLSWFLVHTLFTLRYAKLYYVDDEGGVNFNQKEPPQYTDFAYLAFTLGATFQVSDTNIEAHNIRVTVLRHGLLAYLFGSVIVAATVNLVAGLAGS